MQFDPSDIARHLIFPFQIDLVSWAGCYLGKRRELETVDCNFEPGTARVPQSEMLLQHMGACQSPSTSNGPVSQMSLRRKPEIGSRVPVRWATVACRPTGYLWQLPRPLPV